MANIQIRTSEIIKDLASEIFEEYGLELTSAIRLFLKKTIVEGKLPFDMKYDNDKFASLITFKTKEMVKSIGDDEEELLNISNEIISESREERKENSGKNNKK